MSILMFLKNLGQVTQFELSSETFARPRFCLHSFTGTNSGLTQKKSQKENKKNETPEKI